jgi:hypothetical protein
MRNPQSNGPHKRQQRSVTGKNESRSAEPEQVFARSIKCDYCGATFQTMEYMHDHIERFAGTAKHPFTPDVAKYQF